MGRWRKGSDWARFLTGLTITGISFIPVVGLPAAIILGSIEAGRGFDGFYKSMDEPADPLPETPVYLTNGTFH